MYRLIAVVALLVPSLAMAALDTRGGTNSPEAATGGGFFGRMLNTRRPAADPRQIAQFGPPRQTGTVQVPQQQQQVQGANPQLAPGPGAGSQPAAQPGETPVRQRATPAATPRRPRKTPDTASEPDEKADETSSKKPASDSGDLDQMVKKLEKDKAKANELENELTKSADEATTIVAGFLRSANDGVYSKAAGYLAPELQKYFESEMSAVNGGIKTVLDELTRNGDIRSVTYANATVRGEGAVVDAELTFGSGGPEKKMFDLLKTKTGWKIVLPVNRRSQTSAAPADRSRPSAVVFTPPAVQNTPASDPNNNMPSASSTPTPPPSPAATGTPAPSDPSTTSGAAPK
ncbi:MAG: hypothetical protein ACR2IE_12430 [Candidatus Sumerlaeaceae bacterium]